MKKNHLCLLLAGAAASLSFLNTVKAGIIESGIVNLTIPDNNIGLYLNFIDGTSFTGPANFPNNPGPGANYDLNIYGGTTTWNLFSPGTTGQSAPPRCQPEARVMLPPQPVVPRFL